MTLFLLEWKMLKIFLSGAQLHFERSLEPCTKYIKGQNSLTINTVKFPTSKCACLCQFMEREVISGKQARLKSYVLPCLKARQSCLTACQWTCVARPVVALSLPSVQGPWHH